MPDNKAGKIRTCRVAFWVALLLLLGLAACGGGGGGGSTPPAAAPATPAAPAILTLTDPHSIQSGTTTTIGWSSSDASSCVLYNTTATSGTISTPTTPVVASGTASSYTTPALISNTTYTLECSGAAGTSPTQQTTTVTVVPLSVYAYLTATPSTITIGTGQQYTTLAWSSINSTSCSLTGVPAPGLVGTANTTPDFTVPGTYSYTFSCSGAAGTNPAQQTATVTVSAASVPTVTLTATPPTIANNATTFITWSSTNSTSCQFTAGTGAPGGALATSGNFTTPALTVNPTTYTISCTGPGGTASQSATVTVNPPTPAPTVTVTASPSTIASGQSSTITWTSTNATSCSSAGGGGTGPTGAFTTPALAATTTYTVSCSGPGGGPVSGGATVTISGGACSTTGDTGAITLSNVPARLNGVAPLAVFFDASGSTANATTRPFHELEYRWNFGDVLGTSNGATTWGTGSNPGVNSRNTATGPVAAHVFERPGTYTVTLDITDGTNAVQNGCTTIVVQDPAAVFSGNKTVCVGATAVPTAAECPGDDGTEIRVMQSNFTSAISAYATTGKRVLFRRGDTFTISTAGASITQTGPGMVGAFGSGNLPLIQVLLNDRGIFSFGSTASTPAFQDWRLMDLEFDGMGGSNVTGVGNAAGVTQITLLRLTMRRFEAAIGIADGNPNYWNNWAIVNNRPDRGGHTVDQIAIVDSTVTYGPNTHYGGYNAGNRFAFMGNYIDNGGLNTSLGDPINGSHVARFPYLGKAVISNNDLLRPGFDRLGIKLHAPTWSYNGVVVSPNPGNPTPPPADESWWFAYSAALSGDGYSKQIVISDNKLVDFINPWSIAIGPQAANTDERVRDVILERNLHVGTATSQVAQLIRSRETTVRNNLILGGANTTRYAVRVEVDGPELPARDVWIYNNTQYTNGSIPANEFVMVSIGGTPNVVYPSLGNGANVPSNITVRNNLAYAPNATNPRFNTTDAAAQNVVVSNNSSDIQVKNGPVPFTIPAAMPLTVSPFTVPASFFDNFMPTAGSYALNAGATVPYAPAWSDILLYSRPQSSVPDIGAVERH